MSGHFKRFIVRETEYFYSYSPSPFEGSEGLVIWAVLLPESWHNVSVAKRRDLKGVKVAMRQ